MESKEFEVQIKGGASGVGISESSKKKHRCFKDSSRSTEELIHFFLFTLFSWIAGWLAPRVISFSNFLFFLLLSLVPLCILPVY